MLTLSLLGLAARSLGLLFIISLCGLFAFRSSSALCRIVWLIGIIAAIALPFVWRAAPMAKVPADHIPGYMSVVNKKPIRVAIGQLYDFAKPPKPIAPVGVSLIDPKPTRVSPIALILAAWAFFSGLLLIRLAVGLLIAFRLIRRATPFLNKKAQSLTFHAGISRPVRILLSDRVAVPAAAGIFRPVVLLPVQATDWSEDKVKMVLAHEMAHIKQNDWVCTLVAQFACAMYPFNPFVWLCESRLRAESELAADDRAIMMGIEPINYANNLVDIAAGVKRQPAVVIAMARNTRVEGRVRAIISRKRRRGAAALVPILFAALAATTACGAISAFRISNPSSMQAMGGAIAVDYNSMTAGWKGPLSVHVVDENGKPCPGAKLTFLVVAPMGYGHATVDPEAVTDANGDYQLDPGKTRATKGEPESFFRAGSIEGILAYSPGHALSLGDEFTRGKAQTTVRLTAANAARIHVVEPSGRPAAGIALTATDFIEDHNGEVGIPQAWRTGAYRVVTNSVGSAVFRDVPTGYSVRYTVDDDRYLPPTRYQDNPPVSGMTDYPTLHLIAGATIEGDLRLNGMPVSGVQIQVNSSSETFSRHGVSDASGHYRIIRVPYGLCDVHYFDRANGHLIPNGWVAKQQNGLQISAGMHLTGIDFIFERGGIVKGTIVDENGKPRQFGVSAMSPEFVEFRNGIVGNPSDFGMWGPDDGTYELRLPAGRYKLRLSIGPDNPGQWVDIKEGEVTIANFQVDVKSRTRTTGGNMCGQEVDDTRGEACLAKTAMRSNREQRSHIGRSTDNPVLRVGM